jgi:hypothetical protein
MNEYYTPVQIFTEFNEMSKDSKMEVLYEAINIMQQYNGRSRFECIAKAMGYENHEGEGSTYTKER